MALMGTGASGAATRARLPARNARRSQHQRLAPRHNAGWAPADWWSAAGVAPEARAARVKKRRDGRRGRALVLLPYRSKNRNDLALAVSSPVPFGCSARQIRAWLSDATARRACNDHF